MTIRSRGQASSPDQLQVSGADYQSADYRQVLDGSVAIPASGLQSFIPLDTTALGVPLELELLNTEKNNVVEIGFSVPVVGSAAAPGSIVEIIPIISPQLFAVGSTAFAVNGGVGIVNLANNTEAKVVSGMTAIRGAFPFARLRIRFQYVALADFAIEGTNSTTSAGIPSGPACFWAREIGGGIIVHGDDTPLSPVVIL